MAKNDNIVWNCTESILLLLRKSLRGSSKATYPAFLNDNISFEVPQNSVILSRFIGEDDMFGTYGILYGYKGSIYVQLANHKRAVFCYTALEYSKTTTYSLGYIDGDLKITFMSKLTYGTRHYLDPLKWSRNVHTISEIPKSLFDF